jgi:YfiH family protein
MSATAYTSNITPERTQPLKADLLADQAGLQHGFFTRHGGVSTGLYHTLNGGQGSRDDAHNVAENRARIAQAIGVAANHLMSVYQVHSPDCLMVEGPWLGERPKADAMVTATPGLALGILTADCAPVLFADHQAGVVGAAHAGWKGAVTGVLESTVEAMCTLGASRKNITAVIGPTISQAAYEVGPEFIDRFKTADPANGRFFVPSEREHHAMFDLPGYIADRLTVAGVGQVQDTALCTYSDEERFFSYRRATHRREPDYGRLISAIALKG